MRRLKVEEVLDEQTRRHLAEQTQAGADAVVLTVRGGELIAVVPAATLDEQAVGSASVVRASLRLENERVLTIEIHRGAQRASFDDAAAELHETEAARTAPSRRPASRIPVGGRGWTAETLMTRTVVTASPDELVEDIAKKLSFHNISGMPVEDWDGKVIGVISEMDVIGRFHDTVRDAMTTLVASVSPQTSISEVASLMTQRRIKRVPVVENGRLRGIVSRADIVRALAEQAG